MQERKLSKYDASPDNAANTCYYCSYYCEGTCTKEQTKIAICDPQNEYCSDFSYDYTLENAAAQKRSV